MINNILINDALSFRSSRRKQIIELIYNLVKKYLVPTVEQNKIEIIIEYIHSSATIIDDMLDNEELRKGIPTFFKRHGEARAAFTSFEMILHAVQNAAIELNDISTLKEFLDCIFIMIEAEKADVGITKRNNNFSPLFWYESIISKKIAGEFLLIWHLCINDKSSINNIGHIKNLLFSIGQFIQYCNDRKDVTLSSPLDRKIVDANIVITYSLPMAIYLEETNDVKTESKIGIKLNQKSVENIFQKINTSETIEMVDIFIKNKYKELNNAVEGIDICERNKILNLINLINLNKF